MSVLYFLESIRNPFLDTVVSVITMLGEETFFMAIALVFFWCIDKFEGYYMLSVGFLGTMINQFLKMTFRIPRPWVKDPSFTIVESAREAASGYSFPSGHTQSSVGVFGSIMRFNKNTVLRIICGILCALVAFSRLYLGVHTPLDVGVSIVIAVILILVLYPFFVRCRSSPKAMYPLLLFMTAVSITFTLYVTLYKFPSKVYLSENIANLLSARKNAFTLLGCILGLDVIYPLDIKFINFSTEAVWYKQIIKILGGIALVIAVKELLRAPLEALIVNEYAARSVRYFLIVLVAGTLWPYIFSKFCKTKGNL